MAPRVVIVGGGFGGLTAAKALRRAPVEVTLIDQANHHLFQPLLYQVAMAGLSPAEIAMPIRSILSGQKNARVLMGRVRGVDMARRVVLMDEAELPYDYLVLAVGACTSYFGHDEWAEAAPGLKSIDDAVEIRRRVLLAFENAEKQADEAMRRELLTYVVIGGGPTGVELAGAIAELSRNVLAKDFRSVDPTQSRVLLLEGGPRILASFREGLAQRALEQLQELGVEVRTGCRVTGIDTHGVHITRLATPSGATPSGATPTRAAPSSAPPSIAPVTEEYVRAATVLWAAGVRANELGAKLGVPVDRMGRVSVGPDCALPGHPEIFAIGDMAAFVDAQGQLLPGVSPVAMQQARFVARVIARAAADPTIPRPAFHYFDKGTMATIGRSRAIAQMKTMGMSGLLAWLAWLFIHVWYLIGFKNRVSVMFTWAWSYLTYRRGARLITGLDSSSPALRAAHPGGSG